mgnify:CR=1 FL=1
MTDIKDKLVSLELLKVYHDYNESAYSKYIRLTYENGIVKDSENKSMSFTDIYTLSTDNTKRVCVANGDSIMFCMDVSTSAIDFVDLHFKNGKYYIGWITIDSGNRVSYKEIGIALSGDIIKNLSEMADDEGHRTVTDEQIKTWNNKSDFSGSWNDLEDRPIATVEQTKAFLNLV